MTSIIWGVALLVAGCAGVWYFKPHNGQLHWHTKVPLLDSMIPIMIMGAFAVAVAEIVAGIAQIAGVS